jgi:hypothetical protein
VTDAAFVGWWIGTKARPLFYGTEVPGLQGGQGTFNPRITGWDPVAKGDLLLTLSDNDETYELRAPADGYQASLTQWSWAEGGCAGQTRPQLPVPLRADLSTGGQWIEGTLHRVDDCHGVPTPYETHAVVLFAEFTPSAPLEGPLPQTINGAPVHAENTTAGTSIKTLTTPASDWTSLRTAVLGAIEDPDNGLLEAELEWAEGEDGNDPSTEPATNPAPPGTPEPTEKQRWCERTPPGVTDVSPPGDDPWKVIETYITSEGFYADLLAGSEQFGDSTKPVVYRTIRGFGLRKIILKHGWTSADRADTIDALLHPATPPEYAPAGTPLGDRGRVLFRGRPYDFPDPSRVDSGAPGRCQRVVVIDRQAEGDEPSARGIITSYGRYEPSL